MAKQTKTAVKAEKETQAPRFALEQLLAAPTYAKYRDVLHVVLEPGKTYTIAEVNNAISNFYERKVK